MTQPVDIRCTCATRPLLGRALSDDKGRWCLHIKVYRQKRIYAEIIADSGTVRVKCRSCMRWHTVRIKHLNEFDFVVREERLPKALLFDETLEVR